MLKGHTVLKLEYNNVIFATKNCDTFTDTKYSGIVLVRGMVYTFRESTQLELFCLLLKRGLL